MRSEENLEENWSDFKPEKLVCFLADQNGLLFHWSRQDSSKCFDDKLRPGIHPETVYTGKTLRPAKTRHPSLPTLRREPEAAQNHEAFSHQGSSMKTKNPSHRFLAQAENSSFPSRQSYALMQPISPLSRARSSEISSLGGPKMRISLFFTLLNPYNPALKNAIDRRCKAVIV